MPNQDANPDAAPVTYPGADLMRNATERLGAAIAARNEAAQMSPVMSQQPPGMPNDSWDLAQAYARHGESFVSNSNVCIKRVQSLQPEYEDKIRSYRKAVAWETMYLELYNDTCTQTSGFYWKEAVYIAEECLREAGDGIANAERAREPFRRAKALRDQHLEVGDDDAVPFDRDGGTAAVESVSL